MQKGFRKSVKKKVGEANGFQTLLSAKYNGNKIEFMFGKDKKTVFNFLIALIDGKVDQELIAQLEKADPQISQALKDYFAERLEEDDNNLVVQPINAIKHQMTMYQMRNG